MILLNLGLLGRLRNQTVLEVKCTRCGSPNQMFHRHIVCRSNVYCMPCVLHILEEWKIKRDEVSFLKQGRTNCKLQDPKVKSFPQECTYEVNHYGKHSWE